MLNINTVKYLLIIQKILIKNARKLSKNYINQNHYIYKFRLAENIFIFMSTLQNK